MDVLRLLPSLFALLASFHLLVEVRRRGIQIRVSVDDLVARVVGSLKQRISCDLGHDGRVFTPPLLGALGLVVL